jgi:hypothetical protein
MSSPTTRANNVWEVNGGDDILQVISQSGASLGGIDSTSAGFGNLAGGGSGSIGLQGDLQLATGAGAFTNAAGVFSGNTLRMSHTTGELQVIANAAITLSATADTSTCTISAGSGGTSVTTTGPLAFEGSDVEFTSDIGSITFISAVGLSFTAPTFLSLDSPDYNLALHGVLIFANNAAAITGGLSQGDLYRTGADPDVLCIVH